MLFERKANEFCRIYSLLAEIKKKLKNKNARSFLKIYFTVGIYLLADLLTKECKHIVLWRKRRNFLADLARSREDIYVMIFYPLNYQLYFLTYVQLFKKTYTTAKLREGQKKKKRHGLCTH